MTVNKEQRHLRARWVRDLALEVPLEGAAGKWGELWRWMGKLVPAWLMTLMGS